MDRSNNNANRGGTATRDSMASLPKKGDCYRCEQCGMEIQVTKECHCDNPNGVLFECCTQMMSKA